LYSVSGLLESEVTHSTHQGNVSHPVEPRRSSVPPCLLLLYRGRARSLIAG
jgi:hypothetical protein